MTEEEIKKMVKDSVPEIINSNNRKWIEFSMYLWEQRQKTGATEFRIAVLEDDSFYVHPLGLDGDTLDGKLFN